MEFIFACVGLVIFAVCAQALTDAARALERGAHALSVLNNRQFVRTEDIEQRLAGIQHAIANASGPAPAARL